MEQFCGEHGIDYELCGKVIRCHKIKVKRNALELFLSAGKANVSKLRDYFR